MLEAFSDLLHGKLIHFIETDDGYVFATWDGSATLNVFRVTRSKVEKFTYDCTSVFDKNSAEKQAIQLVKNHVK